MKDNAKQKPSSPEVQPSAYTVSTGSEGGKDILQKRENKTGMPENLKNGLESLSGYDLSHVRVHFNSSKPAQLQALAYAQGSEIHVSPGQERYLPHEGWHIVQQMQGRVKPTLQMKSNIPLNDSPSLESEADTMGQKAITQAKSLANPRLKDTPISLRGIVQRGQGGSKTAPKERPKEVSTKTAMLEDVALWIVNNAFGRFLEITLDAKVVFHENRESFVAAFKRFHKNTEPEDAVGFTVTTEEQSGREIHVSKKEASFDALVHELIHHNSHKTWNKHIRGDKVIHEGSTQLLTTYALKKAGITEMSGAYLAEMSKMTETNDGIDLALIIPAYFQGNEDNLNKKVGSVNHSLLETSWFLQFGEWEVPQTLNFEEFLKASPAKKDGDSKEKKDSGEDPSKK